MDERKVKGAWMITVKRNAEKKEASMQSNNHQNQRAGGKMKGGV